MSTVTLQQLGSDLASEVIAEHAVVRLRADRTDDGLVAGASGAVVHVYEGGEDYEVEFIVSGLSKLVTVARSELEVITDA